MIGQNDSDERAALLAIAKRRKGAPLYLEHNKDEEDAPDSYMNRVVGAADSYNLEVVKYFYKNIFLSFLEAKLIIIIFRKWKLQVHSPAT